jgi:hypothetical protein
LQPFFKRLPVLYASGHERWPRGDGRQWVGFLWQQTPQRWVVPTQILATAVAVLPDTCTEFLHFVDELLLGHLLYIFIHAPPRANQGKQGTAQRGTALPLVCKISPDIACILLLNHPRQNENIQD